MGRYLITCSGKKITPSKKSQSKLSDLSFDNDLGDFRKHLIQLGRIQLDWTKTVPACELYKGWLYTKITAKSWEKSSDKVLILSALFGWIKPNDSIPYYDLSMNQMQHKVENKLVYRYWLESGLLINCINEKNDIDLLSQPYRKAIHGKKDPVALEPGIEFRDNYGFHKGEWLNQKISE